MAQFKRFSGSESENYNSSYVGRNGELTWDPDNGLRIHDGNESGGNPVGISDFYDLTNRPFGNTAVHDLIGGSSSENNGKFLKQDSTGTSVWAALPSIPADVSDLTDTTGLLGGGGTTLPANASGYLVNDGTGALSWAAGDGTFSGDYDDLTNKPDLTVYQTASTAFSGSYSDLTNKPTIPADVSDLTDTTSLLFSGAYADLSNAPTLFDGDYNSLTNKPELFDGAYNSLTNKPTLFDSDYNSLTNKPTYKETVSTGTGPGGNNQADSLVLAGLNPTENIPSTYGGDLILKGGYGGANGDLFGEVRIKSGTIGSNFEWHFTVDKKIKLPSGGDIVDSTGATVFVSVATLKQIVAASTDFADFQTRIANM